MDSSNIASNPTMEVTPISQSSADPILSQESSTPSELQTTTITASTEGTTVAGPSDSFIDRVAMNLQNANASVAQFTADSIEVAREGAHDLEKKSVDTSNLLLDYAAASKELAGDLKNFTVEKAAHSKDFLVEKAKSSKDFTVQKATQSKDFILEKAKSSKDFTVEKAAQSKEFILEKAKTSRDFTVEKAVHSKELIAEKSLEGKEFLMEKAQQSKGFAAMEYGKGKQFLSSKWDASRKAFWNGSRWMYSKSMASYQFTVKKVQDGSHWLYYSLLAPFMVKSLLLTQSAAEKGKDGLSLVSAKAEELEKKLVEMPSEATDTMASLSGTPLPAEATSTLGSSQLENMSTFYSTLNQPALKVAPAKGTFEEKSSLIHQE